MLTFEKIQQCVRGCTVHQWWEQDAGWAGPCVPPREDVGSGGGVHRRPARHKGLRDSAGTTSPPSEAPTRCCIYTAFTNRSIWTPPRLWMRTLAAHGFTCENSLGGILLLCALSWTSVSLSYNLVVKKKKKDTKAYKDSRSGTQHRHGSKQQSTPRVKLL